MAADLMSAAAPPLLTATPGFADQAMTLLDFSLKLDISLLDSVVNCFYSSTGEEVRVHLESCDFWG